MFMLKLSSPNESVLSFCFSVDIIVYYCYCLLRMHDAIHVYIAITEFGVIFGMVTSFNYLH